MNYKEKKIREGLERWSKKYGPVMVIDGEVTAVDSENYFCDVQSETDDATYSDCRLRAASLGHQSIDILPKMGSAVVMLKIVDDDYLVLACDEIDDIRITANGFTIQLNSGGVSVKSAGDSLKSIMSDLIDQIQQIYAPKDVAAIAAIKVRVGELLQ